VTRNLKWILPIVFALSGCGAPEDSGGSNILPVAVTVPKQISWTPPTQYTDGSLFTDLSKYRIYYGPDEGSLTAVFDIDNQGASFSSYVFSTAELDTLKTLFSGNSTHAFAMTAINSQNIESSFSNIANIF